MAFLFYAYYGNTNSQAICGKNITYSTSNVIQGMSDSTVDSPNVNFWGLANWWGGESEYMDGLHIEQGDSKMLKASIMEDDGTISTIQIPNVYNYSRKLVIGEHLDLFSLDALGNSTTGYCDIISNEKDEYDRIRGGSDDYDTGGVAFATTGAGSMTYSTRLAFRGNIEIENNSETFKSLTAIN
jgi:hypothetical protein